MGVIVLQERDRQILRVCYEQQFLLMEHVIRFFYKDKKSVREAYRRVQELEETGLLRAEKAYTLEGKRALRCTVQGCRVVLSEVSQEIPQAKTLEAATLYHDAVVTSVRLRLREVWVGKWIPERLLKHSGREVIPDGIVMSGDNAVAIEVENSLKSRKRFMLHLRRWERVEEVNLVLFIATTPYLQEKLQDYIREFNSQNRPYGVVLWQDLRDGLPLVWTIKGGLNFLSNPDYPTVPEQLKAQEAKQKKEGA